MHDERARQREREKEDREREKEDREREEKEADRRHELELIQLKSDVNAGCQLEQAIPTRGFNGAVPKLPPFDERTDDLNAYLHRFEGYATMQGWPKERWASNLSALLKVKALGVFHRMRTDDCNDYDLLKVALLNRYRLTDADFRDKFRQAKPEDGESFSQFGNRVTSYLDRWIE